MRRTSIDLFSNGGRMDFSPSPKVVELQSRVMDFVRANVIDAEAAFKTEMSALRAAGAVLAPVGARGR
jgi:hypothetical protein